MGRSGRMLFAGLCCLLFTAHAYAQDAGDYQPATTNVMGAPYPRVDGEGRVQLRVKAPEATKIVANFWSGPKVDMTKQEDGVWTVTTSPLAPGLHYYTFVIDGAEVSDPGSQAFFGGSRYVSAVEIPEPGSTYYSIQDVETGDSRIYASGLRNPVGLDFQPGTDTLWAVVNERDELGPPRRSCDEPTQANSAEPSRTSRVATRASPRSGRAPCGRARPAGRRGTASSCRPGSACHRRYPARLGRRSSS